MTRRHPHITLIRLVPVTAIGTLLATLAAAQPPGGPPRPGGGGPRPADPNSAGSPYAAQRGGPPGQGGPGRDGAGAPRPGGPPGAPAPGGPGGPTPALPRPSTVSLVADGDRWTWLKRSGGDIELMVGGPGGARTSIANGRGWTEVAIDGQTAWLLRRTAASGALLRVQLTPGARPETVLEGLQLPGGIRTHEGRVYWLEMPASPAHFAFVPTAGAFTRLKCREASGEVRELGAWPGGGPGGPRVGDLIGFTPDAALLRVRRLASTELVRLPLAGGAPARVGAENGTPDAVLHAGSLYWTAPSPEATPESLLECVRRLPATSEGAATTVVADWLPPNGRLVSTRDGVFDISEGLYRIPARPGAALFLRRSVSGRAVSDGSNVVLLDEAEWPVAVPARAE